MCSDMVLDLDLQIIPHLGFLICAMGFRVEPSVALPNFVAIARTVAEIWRFLNFLNFTPWI